MDKRNVVLLRKIKRKKENESIIGARLIGEQERKELYELAAAKMIDLYVFDNDIGGCAEAKFTYQDLIKLGFEVEIFCEV